MKKKRSRPRGALLRGPRGGGRSAGHADSGAYGAELLISALETEAFQRGHANSQVAVALGIHPTHWYRLRARPLLLARCERETHESIATYLRWPIGRVMLASGVVTQEDFTVLLGGDDAVADVIARIEGGPYGAGLVTPLREAERDHQLLVAELFVALCAECVRAERPVSSRAPYVLER